MIPVLSISVLTSLTNSQTFHNRCLCFVNHGRFLVFKRYAFGRVLCLVVCLTLACYVLSAKFIKWTRNGEAMFVSDLMQYQTLVILVLLDTVEHLEDPGVHGKKLSPWLVDQRAGGGHARTGLIWLRIGTGGGCFWMLQWTVWLYKMRRISWVAKDLLASQEARNVSAPWS
jgi:hypothetical protein